MSASAKTDHNKGAARAAERPLPPRPAPPRLRILAAASELFYRHGIRAVSVDAIAEAADTNKMTLYRHFPSKDALVAEYLRGLSAQAKDHWDAVAREFADDPAKQMQVWLESVAQCVTVDAERGCALANAAVELPEKDHPARAVIEEFKNGYCRKLTDLFRAAGLTEPQALAEEVFLLIEGARINIQEVGPGGPASRLVRMIEALIEAHKPAAD
jgi:AcrR family transcriptional regulator